jgi:hypothetical protein
LLDDQFLEWAELPLRRIEPAGTVNAIFRLGDQLALRLARRQGSTKPGGKEHDWLPKLAPPLPLRRSRSRSRSPLLRDIPPPSTRGFGTSTPG